MANCLAITLCSFPFNLSPTCFQPEGALDRENLVDFRNDWQRLKSERADVMIQIEIKERQRMRRMAVVDQWLQRITELEVPAETLIAAYTPEDANTCFCGYCKKNQKKCYEFKRKMAPMVKEVKELLELRPVVVAQKILIAPVQKLLTERTYGMESMLTEVLSQIDDDEKVGMIGLYGMGGVGKTTLLKEINNKLCTSETICFDLLLWIVVSKSPNLALIQDNIVIKLAIPSTFSEGKSQELKALEFEQKAHDISNVLDNKKYIILLDDLWEPFDLIKMGIPPPSLANQSKVVFTTRSMTLCGEMKAREIQVKCLTNEESWNLFRENVGEETVNSHPDIPELADIIMKECKNLPLALKVIGRAMTRKTSPASWKLTINSMKRNATDFAGVGDQVFSVLKYSYDNLPNSSIKSCFLYCSLYPEDEEIRKDEMIDKWICEGYLDKYNDLYNARYAGYDYISTLVNASLLEEGWPESFKLHDVIRDMAMWIGCEGGVIEDKFLVQTRSDLTKIPNAVNWGSVERMSFIGNGIEELTEIPHCSKTLTMFLESNNLRLITDRFFESLQNIRVLDLSSNMRLEVLPNSICELVNLQYLNLTNTAINELPAEFNKLVDLKYLSLDWTNIFYNIREGELQSFKKLQVLHLERNVFDSSRESTCVRTILKDLDSLECLKDLTFTIGCETGLSEFTSSVKLLGVTTYLQLCHFDASRYLDISFLEMMKYLDSLHLGEMKNLENMNVRSAIYFNNLHRLHVYECPKLEDLTWIAFAPNIEEIWVGYCTRMKRLVGGSVWDENVNELERRIPFSKLKMLHLIGLQQLESISPRSLPFPCVWRLNVRKCEKLKKLPFNLNSCARRRPIIECDRDWWNNLEWEDEATKTKFSSTFKPSAH